MHTLHSHREVAQVSVNISHLYTVKMTHWLWRCHRYCDEECKYRKKTGINGRVKGSGNEWRTSHCRTRIRNGAAHLALKGAVAVTRQTVSHGVGQATNANRVVAMSNNFPDQLAKNTRD
jgi:hypothetical protein